MENSYKLSTALIINVTLNPVQLKKCKMFNTVKSGIQNKATRMTCDAYVCVNITQDRCGILCISRDLRIDKS